MLPVSAQAVLVRQFIHEWGLSKNLAISNRAQFLFTQLQGSDRELLCDDRERTAVSPLPQFRDGVGFTATCAAQRDGGAAWARAVHNCTNSDMRSFVDCEDLLEDMHSKKRSTFFSWFDSRSIKQPEIVGTELLIAINDAWLNGLAKKSVAHAGWAFALHVLAGHTKLCFGDGEAESTEDSGLFIIEMVLRAMVHREDANVHMPGNDFNFELRSLCLASFAAASAADITTGRARLVLRNALPSLSLGGLNYVPLVRWLHKYGETALAPENVAALGKRSCELGLAIAFGGRGARELDDIAHVLISEIDPVAEPHATVSTTDYGRSTLRLGTVTLGDASITAVDVAAFAAQPLSAFVDFEAVTSQHAHAAGAAVTPAAPPFDLFESPSVANSALACASVRRLVDDCAEHARRVNGAVVHAVAGMTPEALDAHEEAQRRADASQQKRPHPPFAQRAEDKLDQLAGSLTDALRKDRQRVEAATAHVLRMMNCVREEDCARGNAADPGVAAHELRLLQCAGLHAQIRLPQLVAALTSTAAVADLRRCNPFLSEAAVQDALAATAGIVLRTCRVLQLRRTIAAVAAVKETVTIRVFNDVSVLRKEIDSLLLNLLGARAYMRPAATDGGSGGDGDGGENAGAGANGFELDPRFLVFEYMFGWLLRAPQVYLVDTMMACATAGGDGDDGGKVCRSVVHQMIMGAGKTTTVGPLLALMLSDGRSLVTQVVPGELLSMSRAVMWSRFTQVITKPVYTLAFARNWPVEPAMLRRMHRKLARARRLGGIVVTTPSVVKSLVNKFVELLSGAYRAPLAALRASSARCGGGSAAANARLARLEKETEAADAIAAIIDLWSERQRGVLLLDEVDLLLHPLKSELNFPIGIRAPCATPRDTMRHSLTHVPAAHFFAFSPCICSQAKSMR